MCLRTKERASETERGFDLGISMGEGKDKNNIFKLGLGNISILIQYHDETRF